MVGIGDGPVFARDLGFSFRPVISLIIFLPGEQRQNLRTVTAGIGDGPVVTRQDVFLNRPVISRIIHLTSGPGTVPEGTP
jgi:hypothetical protein